MVSLSAQVEEQQFQEYAGKVIAEAKARRAYTQPLQKAAKAGAGLPTAVEGRGSRHSGMYFDPNHRWWAWPCVFRQRWHPTQLSGDGLHCSGAAVIPAQGRPQEHQHSEENGIYVVALNMM